jgi:hypothetical protein
MAALDAERWLTAQEGHPYDAATAPRAESEAVPVPVKQPA